MVDQTLIITKQPNLGDILITIQILGHEVNYTVSHLEVDSVNYKSLLQALLSKLWEQTPMTGSFYRLISNKLYDCAREIVHNRVWVRRGEGRFKVLYRAELVPDL